MNVQVTGMVLSGYCDVPWTKVCEILEMTLLLRKCFVVAS